MEYNFTEYEHVRQFLQHKYPGDSAYVTLFTQVVALNEMFEFVYSQAPALFEVMDQKCPAFQHLANYVICIQKQNRQFAKDQEG